jgi:hypothetical protein
VREAAARSLGMTQDEVWWNFLMLACLLAPQAFGAANGKKHDLAVSAHKQGSKCIQLFHGRNVTKENR